MKEHPILFNTPMVQVILDGRKTQTRRIIKPQPNSHDDGNFPWLIKEGCEPKPIICPYGQPGDLLWVKETWKPIMVDAATGEPRSCLYLTDIPAAQRTGIKFKPSIHMPKAAARIWLQIEEIQAERLKDISEEDAKAEGTPESYCVLTPYNEYWAYGFNCLWNKINGIESWDRNPWVWVITFKVISTTGKPKIVNRKS